MTLTRSRKGLTNSGDDRPNEILSRKRPAHDDASDVNVGRKRNKKTDINDLPSENLTSNSKMTKLVPRSSRSNALETDAMASSKRQFGKNITSFINVRRNETNKVVQSKEPEQKIHHFTKLTNSSNNIQLTSTPMCLLHRLNLDSSESFNISSNYVLPNLTGFISPIIPERHKTKPQSASEERNGLLFDDEMSWSELGVRTSTRDNVETSSTRDNVKIANTKKTSSTKINNKTASAKNNTKTSKTKDNKPKAKTLTRIMLDNPKHRKSETRLIRESKAGTSKNKSRCSPEIREIAGMETKSSEEESYHLFDTDPSSPEPELNRKEATRQRDRAISKLKKKQGPAEPKKKKVPTATLR